MNNQHTSIVLKQSPNMFLLMFKAALKRTLTNISASQLPKMDNKVLVLQNRRLAKSKIQKFNQLVAWRGAPEILHPCILHTLLFPLHLKLFLDKNFPFSLLGLVHVKNEIRQIRPVYTNEDLDLSCYLADFEVHPKGWMFSVCSQVFSGGKLVWESKSSNLFRLERGVSTSIAANASDNTQPNLESKGSWRLGAALGYQYARSSGDYNLIHLNSLLARLFGFKRHIAHGMWTKARSLSALQQLYPESFEQQFSVQVKFIKAIFLPAKVEFCRSKQHSTDNCLSFTVRSPKPNSDDKIQHLQGSFSSA